MVTKISCLSIEGIIGQPGQYKIFYESDGESHSKYFGKYNTNRLFIEKVLNYIEIHDLNHDEIQALNITNFFKFNF